MTILINATILLNIIIDEIKEFFICCELLEAINCIPFN